MMSICRCSADVYPRELRNDLLYHVFHTHVPIQQAAGNNRKQHRGTPAVVYDSTACPEIVTPGTGYVVPVGDIEGILNCCRLIKENGKDIYMRLCRASTENRFDKEKLIAETFALYAEVTETIA